MMSNRYRASSRRCSVLPAARIRSTTCSKRRQNSTNPPVMSNIQGMRGKMSKNCLWHACQALFLGILLFSIGAVMSTLGFQADGLLDGGSNGTTAIASRSYIYNNESRTPHIRFSKLSYAGPIVMGIGGFIIVATCVLTFEARDSAAKVGPASYTGARSGTALYTNPYRTRARSLDVRSVGSQTIEEPSVTTTSFPALHIFDKKSIFETFKKFSRTIRTGSSKDDQFHRSPSAPSLLAAASEGHDADRLTEEVEGHAGSTARRASVLPKMKISSAARGPVSSGPRGVLRQTMSVDCPIYSPSTFIHPSSKMSTSASSSKSRAMSSSAKNVTVLASSLYSSNKDLRSQSTMPKSCIAKGKASSPNADLSSTKRDNNTQCEETRNHYHPTCSYPKAQCVSSISGRQGIKCATTNLNVHFEPATVELHLPNGSISGSGAFSPASSPPSSDSFPSTSALSPLPAISRTSPQCFRPKGDDRSHSPSSSGRPHSARSEDHIVFRSPSLAESGVGGGRSRPKLRTELSCRPILMRQSRIDHSEIVSLPDSDEENLEIDDFEGPPS